MQILLHAETTINYAHSLPTYEGACKRTHGHDALIKIEIIGDSSQLDENGILFDFNNVKKIKEELCHYNLNDILPTELQPPSAEHIALYIYHRLHEGDNKNLTFKVRFYETSNLKENYVELGDF